MWSSWDGRGCLRSEKYFRHRFADKSDYISNAFKKGFSDRPDVCFLQQLVQLAAVHTGISIFGFVCKDAVMRISIPSRDPGSYPSQFSVQRRARCYGLTQFIDKF